MSRATGTPASVTALSIGELGDLVSTLGEPRYRAGQILDWICVKGARSYDDMSNLPGSLRARLSRETPLYSLRPLASAGGTRDEAAKHLFGTLDGDSVEAVLIRQPGRNTACVSSQIGCRLGCAFCATGRTGFSRNLRTEEIVEQIIHLRAASRERIHNVVYMGMGEPLLNYDAVIASARRINAPAPEGLGIAARRITISTVGVIPGIRRLAKEKLQVELAVSLHAPDDATRRLLIPATGKGGVAGIVKAAREYYRATNRQVTFEYVLLRGVNDSPAQAWQLASLLRGFDAKVNLIPFNPVDSTGFERPGDAAVKAFSSAVSQAGIPVTVRRSRGVSVDAACGQLRRRAREGRAP